MSWAVKANATGSLERPVVRVIINGRNSRSSSWATAAPTVETGRARNVAGRRARTFLSGAKMKSRTCSCTLLFGGEWQAARSATVAQLTRVKAERGVIFGVGQDRGCEIPPQLLDFPV